MILAIDGNIFTISGWNDLSCRQLLFFCKQTLKFSNPSDIKLRLLFNFCGLRPLRRKISKDSRGLSYQWFRFMNKRVVISLFNLNSISEAILNIFYKVNDEGNYSVNSSLSRNTIKRFRLGLINYYGPASELSNLSFKEFIHCESYFSKLTETSDPVWSDRIIAVLYRRRENIFRRSRSKFNGDIRIPFNDFRLEQRASRIKHIKPELKRAILYFYTGCRRHLIKIFPEVFTPGSGSGSSSDIDTFRMYMHLVDQLADFKPERKEQIRDLPLYEVLDTLNNLALKNRKK